MDTRHAPPPARAARGNTQVYALVRAQGRTVAIASEGVRQAVPRPAALAGLPRRAGALEGMMTLDRQVLPVVSLAAWLAPAADADPDPPDDGLVLLLQQGEARIGLAIEAVVGVRRLPADQARRLCHDDRPDELFHSAAVFGSDDSATPILDPQRLMALAGTWVAEAGPVADAGPDEAGAGPSAGGPGAPAQAGARWACFRIGDAAIGLPAAHVGELLRPLPLRKELLSHDGVRGLCEWRGRLVPVVDLCGALQALPVGASPAWWCIVCAGDRAIGLVVHEVLPLARLARDEQPAPTEAHALVNRRLVHGEGLLQLIDVEALMQRYGETAISMAPATSQRRRSTGAAAPAYMVFEAGGPFAAEVGGVQAVVPVPAELRPRLEAGLPATLQWRQQPVPVRPLADGLVGLAAQAARQLVVVRTAGQLVALPIGGVRAMVPRNTASCHRMRLRGRMVEVITVQTDGELASYPVVALEGAPVS